MPWTISKMEMENRVGDILGPVKTLPRWEDSTGNDWGLRSINFHGFVCNYDSIHDPATSRLMT